MVRLVSFGAAALLAVWATVPSAAPAGAAPDTLSPASVVAAGGAPQLFAPATEGQIVIYRGATLIDGTGGPARADMAVVTDGPIIREVVPSARLTPATLQGARIVELHGRYLLPGLIDSHQHLATPPNRKAAEAEMRRGLYSGITAIRDMADDVRSIAELARAARVGEIEGPDIFYSVLVAGPSFFEDPRTRVASLGAKAGGVPWMQAITDDTDLRLAVAMARGTSATGLKIYANLPPHLVKALAAEAHGQGLRVWAHGMVFPTPPADVIAAAPDVISHTCYLAYQVSANRPQSYQDRFPVDYAQFKDGDNPVMAGLFREMKRQRIILDPTIRVYAQTDKQAAKPGAKPYHCNLDLAARLTNQAWREGVELSTGTDGATEPKDPYPALHEELVLLAERAGMPPAQVIRSATLVGAMTIGEEARMGTIAAGKLANFVVVEKNPLQDLRNLRSVMFTVKRGHRFDRGDYRPIGPGEIPAQ